MQRDSETSETEDRPFPRLLIGLLAAVCALTILALLIGLAELNHTPHVSAQAPLAVLPDPITPSHSLTPSRTPFQPSTYTPTPTPSATFTATFTFTPTNTPTATPMPSNTPVILPDRAYVNGIKGHNQTLGLSCESRSAVDFAAFFGTNIGELEFLAALPRSDNPEKGFVGNPDGISGQLPPRGYGVYAGPVAALLRAYGVSAEDQRDMEWDDVRREIAQGQPVIVWVISGIITGHATTYHAQDGSDVVVAPYEHTVMVVGYTQDTVAILDGSMRYAVPTTQFLRSWATLGRQAIFRP